MPERAPAAFVDLVTTAERRDRFVATGHWDDQTLAGRAALHAVERPASIAVIDEGGRYSFGRLAVDAAALAGWMAERGVGPGRVVSIQLPNRYELVVAAVAAQSLGAVVNPLLPNYRARELVNVFTTVRPAVVLTPAVHRDFDHRDLIAEVTAASATAPAHVVVGGRPGPGGVAFEEAAAGGGRLAAGRADAVSEVIFTSGTEARPKAIMHTEQTANFSVRVAYSDLEMTGSDVVWMPSPMGHSTGFNYGMRFAVYHGLPLVLQDRWDADAAAEWISRERCSYTLAATTFLGDLVASAGRTGADLSSMRAFGCGGAPVPPPLVDAAAGCGIQVLRLYGSTEVLVGTWNRPTTAIDQRRHSDGRSMSHVETRACDEEGRPVGLGEEGELHVRGPNTCVGFFDDPDRTAQTFLPDGWVRSGDVVTIDADGYVTVVGRRKEILIRGGLNIAPREIEELLLQFDEVAQAAVIGLPDDRLGERMCACVVLAGDATLTLDVTVDRLRRHGLATYKLPERLEICDSLPMTASGKVQKHVLVDNLTGGPR
ncbi:MAG TPA: AMP-binding protein [Acidimicrobiales bacterium]|nr:AMP-binding protein [Acidimicrobiales bacterium]